MTTNANLPAAAAGAFQLGDMTVYRMGFGAMRVTGDGIWGPPKDHNNALAVLRRAVELGVNLIDTADSYGPNVSEELIAEALHPYPDGLLIATKGGMARSGPNQWQTDGRPEHLREVCEGSLRRLKVDQIDLYQFHRPDPKVPFEDSVGEIARMQSEGKIRHVGLSNVTVDQLHKAQKIVPVVSVQNRYNISDRASEEVLQACERENIGFLPWAPLMGSSSKLESVARAHNATTGQVTLAWLLWHSPAMLPIPGTSSIKHLEENVAAASLNISDSEFESLRG